MCEFFSVYCDMVNSREVNHYVLISRTSQNTKGQDATTQKNHIDLRGTT